jgi:hypothetical protein
MSVFVYFHYVFERLDVVLEFIIPRDGATVRLSVLVEPAVTKASVVPGEETVIVAFAAIVEA